jgi:NAD(P)-dependent dehydrogenase (short-subunit alcohol dehydrogenase family)
MASSLPVAIVTGTNSGVGLALAVRLGATFRVFAGMRGVSAAKRESFDAAAASAGVSANITVVDLDVNSDESVNSAIGAAINECGRCDVLVNNAGYSVFGSVEMIDMDTMQAQLNTNVLGVIRCQKAVLPTMRKQKSGKIINISSVGGVWGQPFNDIYCASKFAVEGLTESQAPLFRTFGVYVSSVQPGAIKSNFIENANKPDFAAIPPEYGPGIQSTMAAYQASAGSTLGQTSDEVAEAVMNQVINVEKPPVKVQTNPGIQGIFAMQKVDATGETGVAMATDRFLTPAAAK